MLYLSFELDDPSSLPLCWAWIIRFDFYAILYVLSFSDHDASANEMKQTNKIVSFAFCKENVTNSIAVKDYYILTY